MMVTSLLSDFFLFIFARLALSLSIALAFEGADCFCGLLKMDVRASIIPADCSASFGFAVVSSKALSLDEGWVPFDDFMLDLDPRIHFSIINNINIEIVDYHHSIIKLEGVTNEA